MTSLFSSSRSPRRFVWILLAAGIATGVGWQPVRSRSFFELALSAQGAPFTVAANFAITATAGSGGFGTAAPFTAGGSPVAVAVGDVNGDGHADLVVANLSNVLVFLGNGSGSFGAATPLTAGTGPGAVALADLNNDGKLDVVAANRNDGTVSVFINSGGGSFAPAVPYNVGSFPFAVAIGDVTGDGKLDIVTANAGGGTVSVLPGVGNGTFGGESHFSAGSVPIAVAIADLDGDLKADIVAANFTASGTVSVLLNAGGGSFPTATPLTTGSNSDGVAIADLNGDGRLDLSVANQGSNNVSVLLGTGGGNFAGHTEFPTGTAPTSVAVGDVNADGVPDLVTASNNGSSSTTVSLLLGSGTGSFPAKVDFVAGAQPNQAVLADVNGDGALDVAAANFAGGTASVLLGLGGSIAPPGVTSVAQGGSQTYTITPASGYAINDVKVDGVSQGAITTFPFTNVQAAHTINASFVVASSPHISVEQPAGTALTNPGSKDFGSVAVGANGSLTFTIKNTGQQTLTGVGVTIDGTDSAMFSVTATPAATVTGPSGSTTFTVQFAPTASGARTAALHVASNDSTNNPFNVTITGTGTVPTLVVEQPTGTPITSGTSKDFGTVTTGSTSTLSFNIKNTGAAPLTGLGITIDGTDASMFSVTTSPVAPVAPGANTTMVVQFAPTATGARSAALHLTSNDTAHTPFNIGLTGTGNTASTPVLAVEQPAGTPVSAGGSRDFGSVTVNSNASLVFTLKNTGGASLTGLTVTFTGSDLSMFSVTSSPTAPVAPGASTSMTVQFAPTAAGARSATLHIASNDPTHNPFDITLTGTGTSAPTPTIAVEQPAGTSLANNGTRNFGLVPAGSNTSLTFTIKNTGSANLTGLGVTIDGTDAGMFSVTTSPTAPVTPGSSTTMTVKFAPTATGPRAANLHIASNDSTQNPFNIALTGAGAPAAPLLAVEQPAGTPLANNGSRSFGSVAPNATASLTFTLKNAGSANLTGLGVTIDGADSGMFSVTSSPTAPVAPGASTTMTVQFAPTAAGARTASLHIASNDTTQNPFNIMLNGVQGGSNTAIFVKSDTTTKGTWRGTYGSVGYTMANDTTSLPAYAQLSMTAQGAWTWFTNTFDPRALQRGTVPNRQAAAWYSLTVFTIDLNLTDGVTHQVSLYNLDWDNAGRAQKVEVLNADTGTVLDTQNISSFSNGQWLVWTIKGHVTFRITKTGAGNAVVSGLFFDPSGPVNAPPTVSLTAPANNASFNLGVPIAVSANAADSDGTVSQVQFFAGTLPIGTSLTGPYGTSWTPAAGGTYSLTAVAIDNQGAMTTSAPVSITVSAPAGSNTAIFVKSDTTTKGTWRGTYGSVGYTMANDTTSLPAYAQLSTTAQGVWTWFTNTFDPRALQRGTVPNRQAAAWYSLTVFTIDLNLTDGVTHQVSLYNLDWDNAGRAQKVEVLNADSGAVLDTQNISSFSNGQWLVWNVKGHVTFRITKTGAANGVVSGVFLD